MGARLLVTIGTDRATNWVKTPDGQRFNLGPVSVLSFVTKLVLGGNREARRALDGHLRGEEIMLRVDEGRMWELLAPRRSRWARAFPFIPHDQHTSRGTETMGRIDTDLVALEQHVQTLNKVAGQISPEQMSEGVGILMKLAADIKDQSGNKAYYGLGAAVHETGAPIPEPSTVESVQAVQASDLNIDVFQDNKKMATVILDQMEAVDGKIDQLVTAGKKFDSTRAKADIHAVTSKVASIVADIDLTTPWVVDDLDKLAARAEYLHGLFFPQKAAEE